MSKLKFIWIDDDPRRRTSSDNLKKAANLSGEFIDVKSQDYEVEIKSLLKKAEPDLILIDHNLREISTGIFKKGSTFAAYIRETWPECPIVCITAEDISTVDSQKRSLYDAIFSISKISSHYSTIISIAKSFKKLRNKRPQNVMDILSLMKAPNEDRVRLMTILPQELKENFGDDSLFLNISHWIRNTFISRAGFVYDRLWIATILGLKENSFSKVEDLFAKAKYSGIFSDSSNEVWWKSEVLSILSDNVKEFGLPWEKGRLLPSISKKDYSQCYVTGEEYPETVAFIDETKGSKRAPMKLHQTISHPSYEDLLFFEEIRLMKPAE
ncbi:hypothetical protein ACFQ21_02650 [Ohtaekwangia kribbensis]|uniref:Response regulator n=1 Tax=Ohtaekwangia kribbensis TaxID=688913 RepID=A0ABW3JWA9_9BACT